jgi:hypothetical protein
MTGILLSSGGGTGVTSRIGLFDDDNGLFFEYDEGTVKTVIRSSVSGSAVDTKVSQSDWTEDRGDGTGGSRVTIDWTKTHIWFFDYEWLGVGQVRYGLVIGGNLIEVNRVYNENIQSSVYMSTPNLPLRYQLETTADSIASEMVAICSTVISEGGSESLGLVRHASTNGTELEATTEGVIYALIGLRLKTTHIDTTIIIERIVTSLQNASKKGEWLLIFNPTVAGTFTYVDETNSAIQVARGATANTVTGGTVIKGGYDFSGSGGGGRSEVSIDDVSNELHLGAAIDGTRDTMVLCWKPEGGTNAHEVEGGLTWRELA